MTTQHHDSVDPSVTAWASASKPTQNPEPEPPVQHETWRWGWSAWIGIHYGPVPVGLLIGLPILIALGLR